MLVYLIILAETVAGMMQLSWLAVAIGACLLALLGVVERNEKLLPPRGIEDAATEPIVFVIAAINGLVAATAAFLLGRATAWLWGI